MPTGDLDAELLSPSARVIGRRRLVDRFVRLDVVDVELLRRDGSRVVVERDIHDHGNAVAVLPYDPVRQTVVLVRQLRVPLLLAGEGDGTLVEVPAGLINAGENAATAAMREVREEVGLDLQNLEWIGEVYASPGALTEKVTLYLAHYISGNHIAAYGGLADEEEDIEILEWPIAHFRAAIDGGGIRCAKTMLLGLALRLRRPDLFG